MQQSNEYWVNVYEVGIGMFPQKSRENSIKVADNDVIYRIHVKMKPEPNMIQWLPKIVVEELWQVPPNLPVGTKVRITGPKIYNWRDYI